MQPISFRRKLVVAFAGLGATAALIGSAYARLAVLNPDDRSEPAVLELLGTYVLCGVGLAVASFGFARDWHRGWMTALLGVSAWVLFALAGFTALTVGWLLLPAGILGIAALILSLYLPEERKGDDARNPGRAGGRHTTAGNS